MQFSHAFRLIYAFFLIILFCFFRYISRFSLIFRLWEKDDGNHKRDYSCGEKMDAKLTDKICYKGLTHFLVEDKADALVGDEMEKEIIENEDYHR